MSRDDNAPESVDDEVTRGVDDLSKSSASRRRTVRGVDVELVRREAEIASESRKNRIGERDERARNWYVFGGATAGYVVLGFELWRIVSGS